MSRQLPRGPVLRNRRSRIIWGERADFWLKAESGKLEDVSSGEVSQDTEVWPDLEVWQDLEVWPEREALPEKEAM